MRSPQIGSRDWLAWLFCHWMTLPLYDLMLGEIGDLIVEIILQYEIADLVLENNVQMILSCNFRSFVGPDH